MFMGLNISFMPATRLEGGVNYLGVKLSKSNDKLIENNITPLIHYIKDHCTSWSKVQLSCLEESVKIVIFTEIDFCLENCEY